MNTTTPRPRYAVIALTFFLLALVSDSLLFRIDAYKALYSSLPEVLRWLEDPIRGLVFCLIGLYLALRITPWQAIRELGLRGSILTGMVVGFLATTPMLILPLLGGHIAEELIAVDLLFYCGNWPLAEEVLFRGYAFRQLHRRAGWNLWLAAIVTGVVFGACHLFNASVRQLPLGDQFGTIALISVGGILYAWVFARWDDNLWVPFAVHGLMNLWWNVFELADNPLGNWGPNIMRALTVVLLIALTINRSRLPRILRGETAQSPVVVGSGP